MILKSLSLDFIECSNDSRPDCNYGSDVPFLKIQTEPVR